MELAPLKVDTPQLHKLANAVMCQDEEDVQKVMGWAGPDHGSRQDLLNSLQVSCRTDKGCTSDCMQGMTETMLIAVSPF